MVYHPCANSVEVNKLKDLVRNCLRRHIITPLRELDYKTVRKITLQGYVIREKLANLINYTRFRSMKPEFPY